MANSSINEGPLNITDDLIESTPIEKCSLNPRRGKNSRRLLTGFIIFASEARKEVADKYPNENFGFISRLVGDKWRALSGEVRFKYHKRALIHNKRIKDLAQKEGITLGAVDLLHGSHDFTAKAGSDVKLTKKAKLKQGRKRSDKSNELDSSQSNSEQLQSQKNPEQPQQQTHQQQQQQQQAQQQQQQYHHQPLRSTKRCTDSGTQTPPIKYIQPPPRKSLSFSEAFIGYLISCQSNPV